MLFAQVVKMKVLPSCLLLSFLCFSVTKSGKLYLVNTEEKDNLTDTTVSKGSQVVKPPQKTLMSPEPSPYKI